MSSVLPIVLDTDIGGDPDDAIALTVAQSVTNITWVIAEVTYCIPVIRGDRDRLQSTGDRGLALARLIDSYYDGAFREQLLDGNSISGIPADTVSLLHNPLTLGSVLPNSAAWVTLNQIPLRYATDGVFRLNPTDANHGVVARGSTAASANDFAVFCVDRIVQFASRVG